MHHWVSLPRLLLVAALLFSPTAAWSQISVENPASVDASLAAVDSLIAEGQQLEQERRWGEALTFYEEALRDHPNHAALEERRSLSRLHYDLGRRYSDDSFRNSVAAMSARESLDLYAEVLLKLQAHYVHEPNWRNLADWGTAALEVALTDPLFLERHLSGVDTARINHFRRELRAQAARTNVSTRQGAVDVAALAARWGRELLGMRDSTVVLEYICGATSSLDPYSSFLTASQLNEVYAQIDGSFVGLGIELKAEEGSLLIVNVITGSPAQQGGILPGDRIVAVDGQPTEALSTDQAANLLQGPEGSSVKVTVVSAGAAPRVIDVTRQHVEVPSVDEVKMIDPAMGIGYFRLTCFQKTTSRDVDAALWSLHGQGMKSLIIDLRGNPGGLLTTSVDVVDKFVEQGVIVSTRGRSPREDYSYSAHRAGTWQVPLVVLIDGDSASASEIFAGAIRDHHRGTIVGDRSYGKGSVQGIFPLNLANSGLRLTTAKFYSPNGHPFSSVGVSPDVKVQHVARPVSEAGQLAASPQPSALDDALDAAVNVARQQQARR